MQPLNYQYWFFAKARYVTFHKMDFIAFWNQPLQVYGTSKSLVRSVDERVRRRFYNDTDRMT